jgi:hypothetical protein
MDWVFYWYMWPEAVREIIGKLETMSGAIMGLIGLQRVGKSSALFAIESGRMLHQLGECRKACMSGELVPRSALDHFCWVLLARVSFSATRVGSLR